MRELVPTTEREVLLRFVGVERLYPRWAGRLGGSLPARAAEHLRYLPEGEWTQEDRDAGLRAVRQLHGSTLDPLLGLKVLWYAGTLESEELESVRLPSTPSLAALAPSLTLPSLTRALEMGHDTQDGELSGDYRFLKRHLSPGKLPASPCLVAKTTDGPRAVLSGLLVLCVAYSRQLEGPGAQPPLAVDLGVAPELARWGLAPPEMLEGAPPEGNAPGREGAAGPGEAPERE